MCGFAGFFGQPGPREDAEKLARKMAETLHLRGPDDAGSWAEEDGSVAFGFRRLAILDLSPAGHQPMISPSGRFVLVLNGEIYNHGALRTEIERSGSGAKATPWRGHSDTEVLLAGFDAWGIEATVRKAVGMFAFAVWDRRLRRLTLGRDRFGEKPLYYGWLESGRFRSFLFGSDLAAFHAHPGFEGNIDPVSLSLFFRMGYVPWPRSIFRGIQKLEPAHLLDLAGDGESTGPQPYWRLEEATDEPREVSAIRDLDEAADLLEKKLGVAVRGQMVADVPIGAFLSGGVDSSTIAALMQIHSSRPVRTFTVGFAEEGFNEAEHARAVARHLGTDHTEILVSPREAREVIPLLPDVYSEPFADSSQIPTYLVNRLARRHVTVSLSGDGGDEVFGGYNRYLWGARTWGQIRRVPRPLRQGLGRLLVRIPVERWDRCFETLETFLPASWKLARWGDKVHKGARLLGKSDFESFYLGLLSSWDPPGHLVAGGEITPEFLNSDFARTAGKPLLARMMALDTAHYLPDDILVKVDRASMAVSLESRAPFLDHRVVEFVATLPLAMKIDRGVTKRVLRAVLGRHVPPRLIERPKMGFGVPVDQWLRGPLRGWAEDLFQSLKNEDCLVRAGPIRQKWNEHLAGTRNWAHPLWNVLMFLAWRTRWAP